MTTSSLAFLATANPAADALEHAWVPDPVALQWIKLNNHAVTLQAEHAGYLRVSQGRVWVTLGNGVLPRDQNYGDVFLDAGQELVVAKGQRLVFESMFRDRPACFLLHYTHE
ncbi:MAG: DUF2917 domain-containing protein [Burkholderiaceae bacterium]|nr:DUF2917 domain-containing protein [Burkholderiaceae bacterium]